MLESARRCVRFPRTSIPLLNGQAVLAERDSDSGGFRPLVLNLDDQHDHESREDAVNDIKNAAPHVVPFAASFFRRAAGQAFLSTTAEANARSDRRCGWPRTGTSSVFPPRL